MAFVEPPDPSPPTKENTPNPNPLVKRMTLRRNSSTLDTNNGPSHSQQTAPQSFSFGSANNFPAPSPSSTHAKAREAAGAKFPTGVAASSTVPGAVAAAHAGAVADQKDLSTQPSQQPALHQRQPSELRMRHLTVDTQAPPRHQSQSRPTGKRRARQLAQLSCNCVVSLIKSPLPLHFEFTVRSASTFMQVLRRISRACSTSW